MADGYRRAEGWTLSRTAITVFAVVGVAMVAGFLWGLAFWNNAAGGALTGLFGGVLISVFFVLPLAVLSGRSKSSQDVVGDEEPSENKKFLPNPPGGAGGRG